MSSRKKRRRGRWLGYALIALTGGGVGGWHLSNEPLLERILHVVGQDVARDGGRLPVAALVRAALAGDRVFTRRGPYQVRVSRLTLDPGGFRAGTRLNLQVRVLRRDGEGRDTPLWSSHEYGERIAVVGRDELSASWDDRPFEVDWTPGARFVLEAWNLRGLRATKLGSAERADGAQFPLKSGRVALTAPDDDPDTPSVAGAIVLTSRWVGDPGAAPDPPPLADQARSSRTR